jgi:hypothetical protein
MISNSHNPFDDFNADLVMMHLAHQEWNEIWDILGALLENLTPSASAETLSKNVSLQKALSDPAQRQHILEYGSLAGQLLLALLSDPNCKISDKKFLDLIRFHETLQTLFSIFGLHTNDTVIHTYLTAEKKLSETSQKKILLLLGLNTNLDIIEILKKTERKYRLPALCAYLATNKIFESAIYHNKIKLIALSVELEHMSADLPSIMQCLMPYFNCSYIDHPEKHILKIHVNHLIQRFLRSLDGEFKKMRKAISHSLEKHERTKPILFLLMEEFSKGHAMNRSWGRWMKSLQQDFSVCLLLHQSKFDPSFAEDFEKVLPYTSLLDLVRISAEMKPDLIVFPSVGMNFFGVVASNMRLAPLQIMALGHPATSHSPMIDFVYGPACMYHKDAFPNDRYIADSSPFPFRPILTRAELQDIEQQAHASKKKDDPFHIAIIGSNLKVSAPFLDMLEEIEQQSHFPLHFSFFLGSLGLDSLYMQQRLEKRFQKVTFHGWQPYRDFLSSFAKADIVLNPFPFGHTNTIIDTLLMGKICIGMDGIEAASNTEKYILSLVGLEQEFIVSTKEAYIQKFHDFAARLRSGSEPFYAREKIYDVFYNNEDAQGFSPILHWIYQHQDKLKSSSKKYFDMNGHYDETYWS